MNEHIWHVVFSTLIGSCFGVFVLAKRYSNDIFLFWIVPMFSAGCLSLTLNLWYYTMLFIVMIGVLSYLYLQQYGKR